MFPIPLSRFTDSDRTQVDGLEHVCLVIPILADRSDDARAFMRELEGARSEDYAASEQRIGITREVWHLASMPGGDVLIASIESRNFESALELFSASRDDFDLWFKRRLAAATGLNLNDPPAISLPETLSVYAAS
jgi:hypothetical protein